MTDLQLIMAFVVATLAIARLTRLVVDDTWPPMVKLKDLYLRWLLKRWPPDATDPDDDDIGEANARRVDAWAKLIECAFCFAFWPTLLAAPFTWLSYRADSELDWWWWLPALVLAVSYLAPMIVVRDIPADSRESARDIERA